MAIKNSNIISFFQKLGKALMTPIAVLPAAGLLQRLGQPDVWGPNLFGGNGIPWMAAAGNAIIGEMPLLFAIGIAIGLAEDNDGSAGLAGAIGYLVFTKVSYAFAGQIYSNIASGNKFDMGILAGVITGIIAGLLYNRFKEIKLPQSLGFFGGKRFIPIVTCFVMLILGLVFGFVWPKVQDIINYFGNLIATSGVVGAFSFGFFNRLLIPFGLHHIINSIFWFQFGEYTTANGIVTGDILRFMSGDPTAGIFQTGFFPIMMFALPAACLAMVMAADTNKRKEVALLLGGIAFTSFLTGITEPIEFTFLFLAPVLFILHAFLTGVSMALTYFIGIRHGFSFSAGFIDYILNYNLADKPLSIIIVGIIFAFIYFVVFYFSIIKFNIPTPGRQIEGKENNLEDKKDNNIQTSVDLIAIGIANAVGGKRNILYVDSCITRIRLNLKDGKKVDRAELKRLGATGIIQMGQNNIQIIIGTMADPIVSRLRKIK